MRWNQGRSKIDALIADGAIERVQPDRVAADQLLDEARNHLQSSTAIAGSDAAGAYSLVYDAARKALAAVLENQGLRATRAGGHIAVYEAVRAQLDPPMGRTIAPFDRMRRRRNAVEYSSATQPAVVAEEISEDSDKAQAIVDAAATVLDEMSPY